MPNVMATLPNISVALCSVPQSLADAHYQSALGESFRHVPLFIKQHKLELAVKLGR